MSWIQPKRVEPCSWPIVSWKILYGSHQVQHFPGGDSGKELSCQCRRCKRQGFNSWDRKIPWRRAQKPTPLFLPRKNRGSSQARVHRAAKSQTQLKQHTCITTKFRGYFSSNNKELKQPLSSQLSSCKPYPSYFIFIIFPIFPVLNVSSSTKLCLTPTARSQHSLLWHSMAFGLHLSVFVRVGRTLPQ